MALSGCLSLDPVYQRPTLPTPTEFPAIPVGAGTSTVRPVADLAWQTFFLDPKLRGVIMLALTNNRDLRVAIANIDAARAQYHVQRAALLPTVNAARRATYGREPVAATGVTSGSPNHINEHQFTVGLGFTSYELDLFGRVRSLSRSAIELYLATADARRESQITIISSVAADYLTLAADQSQLKTASDTLTSNQATLSVTEARFNSGVDSQVDVLLAQTAVQQTRADVAADVTFVAQDKDALDLVVGAAVPEKLLPNGLDNTVSLLTNLPSGLPSDVLLSRPDVVAAEHTLKSANAQIGAARAAFFPTISLTGSGGAMSMGLSSLFKGAAGQWSFEPQISIPLFDGGANRANLNYQKAEKQVDIAQYEKAIQTAFREVADALARRATIGEQLSADDALVAAARGSLRLSTARYERGSDTYLNVLIAQRTLYSAEQAQIAVRLIRSTNLVTLYAALGGGAA